MTHVLTIYPGMQREMNEAAVSAETMGCGECQTSCQSACKTSCTVANQSCEQKA
jgi:predicted ribosomally synthesized six-cysteine peptide SCIFF